MDSFEMHKKNLDIANRQFKIISSNLKSSIKKNEKENVVLYKNLLLLLVGAIIEDTYYCLIYNSDLFNEEDRTILIKNNELTLLDKWKHLLVYTIDSSFFEYNEKKISNKYGKTFAFHVSEIMKILEVEMQEMIVCRNKIAHGEFKYVFTNDKTKISNENTELINKQNYYDCLRKFKVFNLVKTMIHNLRQSQKAFKRDFDIYYEKFENISKTFSSNNYYNFEKQLVSKYANKYNYIND